MLIEKEFEVISAEVSSIRDMQISIRKDVEKRYNSYCEDFYDIFVTGVGQPEIDPATHKILNHSSFFGLSMDYEFDDEPEFEGNEGNTAKDWNGIYFRLSKFDNAKDNKWPQKSAKIMAHDCEELVGVMFVPIMTIYRVDESYYALFETPIRGDLVPCSKFFTTDNIEISNPLGNEPDENVYTDADLPYDGIDEYKIQRLKHTALSREYKLDKQRVQRELAALEPSVINAKNQASLKAAKDRANKIIERFIQAGGSFLQGGDEEVNNYSRGDPIMLVSKKKRKADDDVDEADQGMKKLNEATSALISAANKKSKYDVSEESGYDENGLDVDDETSSAAVFDKPTKPTHKSSRSSNSRSHHTNNSNTSYKVVVSSLPTKRAIVQHAGDEDEDEDNDTMMPGTMASEVTTVINPSLDDLGVTEAQKITLEDAFEAFAEKALRSVLSVLEVTTAVGYDTIQLLEVFQRELEDSNVENIGNFVKEKVIVMLHKICKSLIITCFFFFSIANITILSYLQMTL